MASALIGLGANLGDRARTLDEATRRLAALPQTRLLKQSQWLATAPIGGPAGQEPFLNGAVTLETLLAPAVLHTGLHEIEAALGRRRNQRWEARVLDLDLLLYDDQVIRAAHLQVPHPGLAYRRFVLEPAAEIAADWQHPTILWSLGRLLNFLNTAPNYLALYGLRAEQRRTFAKQLAAATAAECFSLSRVPAPPSSPCDAEDLPIQSVDRGIESLANMQRSLASVVKSSNRTYVSDFCWSQFPALLGRLPPDDQAQLLARWKAASNTLPPPKLLVVLGGDPFVPGQTLDYRGPYLQVDAANIPQAALAEVIAAAEAMR